MNIDQRLATVLGSLHLRIISLEVEKDAAVAQVAQLQAKITELETERKAPAAA